MRDALRNKCELFTDNYIRLSTRFKWNYQISNRLGALLYSVENRVVDPEAIENCKRVIKDNTSLFSQFKDTTTNFISSVMLSLEEEPQDKMKKAVSIYDAMKNRGFHSSPYLVLAALSIALQSDPYDHNRIISLSKEFYDAMKKEHRFLTSSDDYGYAALLAISGQSVSQSIREMENCYRILKESFSYSNAVQSLSHVLVFGEESASIKCKRVVDLYQALKGKKCKFGNGAELSFLGVLALLPCNLDELVDEIVEINEYLKNKKGFGSWSITNKERIMFAIGLLCSDYLNQTEKNAMNMTLANNITGLILAQQMATIAAISAATTAANSSAST